MAAVAYSTYAKWVESYVPGCPRPLVVDALRTASIEFFGRSTAYRVFLSTFSLTATVSTYTLSGFPTDTELAQIIHLTCDGEPLVPITHEELLAADAEYPTQEATRPLGYTMLVKPVIRVTPVPTETVTNAFLPYVAVQPTLTSTDMEQQYLDEFQRYLTAGALSILQLLPGKPWFEATAAASNRKRFEYGIELARAQVNKGLTRVDVRVTPRVWV